MLSILRLSLNGTSSKNLFCRFSLRNVSIKKKPTQCTSHVFILRIQKCISSDFETDGEKTIDEHAIQWCEWIEANTHVSEFRFAPNDKKIHDTAILAVILVMQWHRNRKKKPTTKHKYSHMIFVSGLNRGLSLLHFFSACSHFQLAANTITTDSIYSLLPEMKLWKLATEKKIMLRCEVEHAKA